MVHFVCITFIYGLLDWLITWNLLKFLKIAISVSLRSIYYHTLDSRDDREESINMVTPQTPAKWRFNIKRKNKILLNRRSFPGLHMFCDSVAKSVRCEDIKFDKSLMKFIKRYEKYIETHRVA